MPMFFYRRPRGPRGGGFFLIFMLLIFLPEFIIGSFSFILPLIMMGALGFVIYKLIDALVKKQDNKTQKTETYKKQETKRNNNNLSNADLVNIDRKLEKYFKNNIELNIINDIALTTQNGRYQSVDSLYITYKKEKLIKLGDFKEEYPDMYNQIINLLLAFSKKREDVMASKVNDEIKKENVLSDAEKYIEKINALNAAIPQEEITNGLYQTCDLLSKIEKSKQSKQDEEKLGKLYDYYLPILTGILENYKELQDDAIKGEEFKKCEAQLIKTIMLINEALKTLYANMHEDDYLNINADMNTLQSLLEKDGYGSDPFKLEEKNDKQ